MLNNKIVTILSFMYITSTITACGSSNTPNISEVPVNTQSVNTLANTQTASADRLQNQKTNIGAPVNNSVSPNVLNKPTVSAPVLQTPATKTTVEDDNASFTENDLTEALDMDIDADNDSFTTSGFIDTIKDSTSGFIDTIKDKINQMQVNAAMRKFSEYRAFEAKNPELAQDLKVLKTLKGMKERHNKLKELKTKYPEAFKGGKNVRSLKHWIAFDKKYPDIANEVTALRLLPEDQQTARIEELKVKYPKFFKTKIKE